MQEGGVGVSMGVVGGKQKGGGKRGKGTGCEAWRTDVEAMREKSPEERMVMLTAEMEIVQRQMQ